MRKILASTWFHTIGGAVLGTILGYLISFLDVAPTAYSKGYRDGVLAAAAESQTNYERDLQDAINKRLPEFCESRVSTLNRQCDNIVNAKDQIIDSKNNRIDQIVSEIKKLEKDNKELEEENIVFEFLANFMSYSQQMLQNLEDAKRIGKSKEGEWRDQAVRMILDIARSQDQMVRFALIFNGKTDEIRKKYTVKILLLVQSLRNI